eukprot:TRINITY_DN10611_c0_g1_i1.p1 TRINITY_DN10611_c0_g1~~TRINITY_DN10611_c0_g1_i1.p1  ORF type:complete len:312 (-),score=10.30 TRINITY_DN10611_c0_g1_i1:166-1059(-)
MTSTKNVPSGPRRTLGQPVEEFLTSAGQTYVQRKTILQRAREDSELVGCSFAPATTPYAGLRRSGNVAERLYRNKAEKPARAPSHAVADGDAVGKHTPTITKKSHNLMRHTDRRDQGKISTDFLRHKANHLAALRLEAERRAAAAAGVAPPATAVPSAVGATSAVDPSQAVGAVAPTHAPAISERSRALAQKMEKRGARRGLAAPDYLLYAAAEMRFKAWLRALDAAAEHPFAPTITKRAQGATSRWAEPHGSSHHTSHCAAAEEPPTFHPKISPYAQTVGSVGVGVRPAWGFGEME